ncbi:MAG: CoA transferase [Chloroflexi bacterium]|nr:CoA transferase [Chloroflexota bacterium]
MLLKGLKVVEMGQFIFVPYAAAHLADLGAEVIKLENPAGGDPQRAYMHTRHQDLPSGDYNWIFDQNNRGKKSLALNVNTPKGQAVAHKLISQVDVFMTNFQIPTLQRMRMDYESLSKVNPRLIYALGTGFGFKGPDRDRGAFDFGIFARCGMMASFGEPGAVPVQCQGGMGDHISAMHLCAAIGMALYYRERTGEGQLVHASLYGSMLDSGSVSLQSALASGQEIERKDRRTARNPLCNSYHDKNGSWFQIASKQPDRNWHDLCEALGLQHLEHDPRFHNTAARGEHGTELVAILDQRFGTMTVEEIEAAFAGRNVHWSPVYTYGMVAKDQQAWENEYIMEAPHREMGQYKTFGFPLYFSRAPAQVRGGTSGLGEDNEQVLLDLGYTWDDIMQLKEQDILL